MKKYLLGFLFVCASAIAAKAAPGDTTWVQVFIGDSLNHYGSFDKPAAFPNGSLSYRKIYMVFTLGEYNPCPSSTPYYCHQWDYTVENYVMTNTGDTFEISRFITPFATSGAPNYPSTWKHKYVFDVTDFYSVLKNSQTFRVFYSGYSWGFTADVKFAFVEGTPERNVLKIDRLWHGSFQYGNSANPISSNVQTLTRTAPANVQSSEMKFTITGHGADALGCCEFASHNYQVSANGTQIDQKAIWRDNCGFNEQYAQGGTWVYDRGNWCPGAEVNTNTHKLTGVTAGSSYTVGVNFDSYTNTNTNYGSYTIEGAVMHYAGFNHTLDASLEDIIAPTNWEGHLRENPSAAGPVVRVRNTGSTAISSIKFAYNVKDSTVAEYTWNGTLAPLAEETIQLAQLNALVNMSLAGVSGTYNFMVRIASVNGAADNDAHNDTLRSQFVAAPMWPKSFLVNMKTNGDSYGGVSETSWVITDMAGNIVQQRINAAVSTTYSDSVFIPQKGVYKLTISDAGCDGLHWWASPASGQGGTFSIYKIGVLGTIPLTNYPTGSQYHDDFGCGFVQYFTSPGMWTTGVEEVNGANAAEIGAYPNPAHGTVTVNISGLQTVNGTLQLVDATGRVVLENKCNDAKNSLNIAGLANGVYMVVYNSGSGKETKLQTRLVITQ